MESIACTPKSLPAEKAELGMRRALELNPANAEMMRAVERTPTSRRGGPRRLAVQVGSRWPAAGADLSVQFLDTNSSALKKRILSHMNAWSQTANVRFRETNGIGMVRIARLSQPTNMSGYWSYLGTDILGVPDDEPTLNLQAFTMNTPEQEYRRVVRHEAGHTLGLVHEHMRADLIRKIDRKKAIAYFDVTQGWTKEETEAQVLTPLSKSSLMGSTEADPLSIMCYQIPGEITKNGKPIPGGLNINPKDFEFAAKIYPKPQAAPAIEDTPEPSPPTPETSSRLEPSLTQDWTDTFRIVVMELNTPDGKPENIDAINNGKTPKYARIYASYGGAQVMSDMRLRKDNKDDKPTHFGNIIVTHKRISSYTNYNQGSLPTDEDLIDFGKMLFETLIHGDVRRLYDEARAKQHHQKLDIVFTSMIPWIADKPWEFAYDSSRCSFLATEDIHMVRNVVTAIPADTVRPQAGPLRILVAAAQPVGMMPLSAEQEIEVIMRGFQPLIDENLVSLEVLARATPGAIHERLATKQFTVVHFIGHGAFDEETNTSALYFENGSQARMPLGVRSIREVFCRRGVRLIFLNSCQSGTGGRRDFNLGAAQSLVSHGLPALVANQYSVLDTSATTFSKHFYWALARGMSIGQAACEARIAVNYSLSGESIDWAVPVVYTRDPSITLCKKLPAKPQAETTASPLLSRAPELPDRPIQVGVWDTDNIFPFFGKTLDTLNNAQTRYGFDLVHLSTPLDTWYKEEKSDDGTPYLHAEKLADRLGSTLVELRVDLLVCITRHWLRDDNWLNLYGWWPEADQPGILIFSVAGINELQPEGLATDRAIANAMVATMAGYYSNADTHERGPKSCPLYFDENRDFSLLSSPQQFDTKCRAQLQKSIPEELPALEKLLQAFQ